MIAIINKYKFVLSRFYISTCECTEADYFLMSGDNVPPENPPPVNPPAENPNPENPAPPPADNPPAVNPVENPPPHAQNPPSVENPPPNPAPVENPPPADNNNNNANSPPTAAVSAFPPNKSKPNMMSYDELNNTYDAVININSIKKSKNGWVVCGKHWQKLQTLYASLIAVLGDFKDGKTHLISLLTGRNLPHSATLHTPGICLTLPKVPTASTDPKKQERLNNCYIDTEGSDQTCKGNLKHFSRLF